MKEFYDLVVIGGGISSCAFLSNLLKKGFKGKIALVEAGRGLGGRCSTRYGRQKEKWFVNHGSPVFNITNNSKNIYLENFIKELLDNKLIKQNGKRFYEVDIHYNLSNHIDNDFYHGEVYLPCNNMNKFVEKLVQLYNHNNQIDFYFESLITKLNFKSNNWKIISNKKEINGKFLICSSTLLLHKRSLEILNINHIPLREAILTNNNEIDEILMLTNQLEYIRRRNFLISIKPKFKLAAIDDRDVNQFIYNKVAEQKYGIERIIFQKQNNNGFGIVIHTKNNIEKIIRKNHKKYEKNLNDYLIFSLNNLLKKNFIVFEDVSFDNISVMNWRASQPVGKGIPSRLQFCKDFKIAFCGDWFDYEGFGTVQGAILSGLELSNKISSCF